MTLFFPKPSPLQGEGVSEADGCGYLEPQKFFCGFFIFLEDFYFLAALYLMRAIKKQPYGDERWKKHRLSKT